MPGCIGRNWPQAPQEAKTATVGRPPPLAFYVTIQEGEGAWAAWNGVPRLCVFDHIAGAHNPTVFWLARSPNPSTDPRLDIRLVYEDPDGPFERPIELLFHNVGNGIDAYVIEPSTGGGEWWEWPTSPPAGPFDVPFWQSDGIREVMDSSVELRVATYDELPADFCDGV